MENNVSTSFTVGSGPSSLRSGDELNQSNLMEQLAQITSFQPAPGSFQADEPGPMDSMNQPMVELQATQGVAPQQPEQVNLKMEILIMLLCGALFDFLSKTIYQLLPGEDSGVRGLDINKWATWTLTLGCQVATAIPPTLQKKNRDGLKNLDINLSIKLVVPSMMAMLVTVTRLAAIVYAPPSVVAIIKISVNLAVLAFIGRCRGKKLMTIQWIALLGCFVGLAVVCLEDFVDKLLDIDDGTSGKQTDGKQQFIGLSLAVLCGVLGGFRNIVEEVLLQGDNLPDVFFVLTLFNDPDEPGAGGLVRDPVIVVLLFFFAITSWGKDAGKLKITKHGSAILVKVIALMFPFGTWAMSLAAFYIGWTNSTGEPVGENFLVPKSFIRLVGFLIILGFAYVFSTAKKPKPDARTVPTS